MSNKSNDQGRAFEYICLESLHGEIEKKRPATIERNNSYYTAKHAWESIENSFQSILTTAAMSAISTIFELEPLIIEDGNDELTLKIQADKNGKEGDVRDILIIRRGIHWEIGLSVKHNNLAVKHSRLSNREDFGVKWYGVKCSQEYWDTVNPIFAYLRDEKKKGTKWDDLPNKMEHVYLPLLNAFMSEVSRRSSEDATIPRKMVEYLLGKYDFYKLISMDRKKITQLQAFNFRGTLNKAGEYKKPNITIPISCLPTRIVHLGFVPGSKTTVEMYMDAGWQFTFRLHNGDKPVMPTLKFDIRIVGMPTSIITINCRWH